MTYTQCTSCVDRFEFDKLNFLSFIGPLIVAVGGIILTFLSGPVGAVLLLIGAYWSIEKVCTFLKRGKLICIVHDQCAIGLVVELEPVGYHKSGFEAIDNDYSVDLLLAPHRYGGASHSTIENDGSQGNFIKPQAASSGLGWAEYHTDNPSNIKIPVLHCEFEGMRICDFCDAVKYAFGIAIGSVVFCAIPVIGWVACVIGLGAVVAILLNGWYGAHEGDPSDAAVNPGDGELTACDIRGIGGDYVVITGDWVYDSAHSGWNEFHPAKSVQKIHGAPYWEEGNNTIVIKNFKLVLEDWCNANRTANEPATQDNQKKPQNRWCIHPELDSCNDGRDIPN